MPGLAQRGDVDRGVKIAPDVDQVTVPPERPALISGLALVAVRIEKGLQPIDDGKIKSDLFWGTPVLVA
jgi:hypothetical protein